MESTKLFEDIFDNIKIDEPEREFKEDVLCGIEISFMPVVNPREIKHVVPTISFDKLFRKFCHIIQNINFINVNIIEFTAKCGKYSKTYHFSDTNEWTITEFITAAMDIDNTNSQYPLVHKSEALMTYKAEFNVFNTNINPRLFNRDMKTLMNWFEHVSKIYNSITDEPVCNCSLMFENTDTEMRVEYNDSRSFNEFTNDIYNALVSR